MAGVVTVDGIQVPIDGQRNLLEVVRQAGIDLPTFCYHPELSVYGACRLCVVEDEKGAVFGSCSTPPADGMSVRTNTPRLAHIRRVMLELFLANHDRECTTCVKSRACKLQEFSTRLGVDQVRFSGRERVTPVDASSPSILRDENKCVLCGNCVRVCHEVQQAGAVDFAFRGADARVIPAYGRGVGEAGCVNCGQCVSMCPTGALSVHSEIDQVWTALRNPRKQLVVQVAPAVRVALGEEFGLPPGEVATGKTVAALRRLGFAQVFDTSFTADLTAVEETTEFVDRLQSGRRLPQLTSCCPAWVSSVEQSYPDKLDQLSSCRSPQQMLGALLKRFYAREQGIDPSDMYVVAVMPCTAKKFEAQRPEFAEGGVRDVDAVLSTQELARMIRAAGIRFQELRDEEFDNPFGFATGAGVIFGQSGGVATAVAREATAALTGERVTGLQLTPVEGLKGVRAAEVSAAGLTIRVAVVSGLGPARELMEALEKGTASYDIVEVMACPGGCTGGGGQPCPNGSLERVARARGLRGVDSRHEVRLARDNGLVAELYRKWLGSPNSEVAHHALHTEYGQRQRVHAGGSGNGNGNGRVSYDSLVIATKARPGSNGSGEL